MCGRFNILTDADALMTTFDILNENVQIESFSKSYNVSPSVKQTVVKTADDEGLTKVPVVRLGSEKQRLLQSAIWPLIPFWAGSEVPKFSTANARSESMTSKPSYRSAWKKAQRCLIPATGFYEWQFVEGQKRKQPWHIYHSEQPVMAFAGLWEHGRTEDGSMFVSCTIVTTKANALMEKIHNSNFRMPVILDPEYWDDWLSTNSQLALQLAVPYPEEQMAAHPISTRINYPAYNNPDCLDPVDPAR